MAAITQDTVIDGVTYRVTQMGADTSDMVLFRSAPAIAGAIRGLVSGKTGADSMVGALLSALANVSPEDFTWLKGVLKDGTLVGIEDKLGAHPTTGETKTRFVKLASVYDDHFRGRNMAAFKWMKFSLEVNFGPFFDEFRELSGELKGLSDSIARQAAPGGPGGSSSPTE